MIPIIRQARDFTYRLAGVRRTRKITAGLKALLRFPFVALYSLLKGPAYFIDKIFGVLRKIIVWQATNSTAKRRKSGNLRTLWGVTPILTLPLLAQCDRKLGFRSNSLVFNTYHISKNFDFNFEHFERIVLRFSRYFPPLFRVFRRLVFYRFLFSYDVFHFFYDKGILPTPRPYGISIEELEILKQSGKILYTYAYGGDVRTRTETLALGSPNICQECPKPGAFCICVQEEHDHAFADLGEYTTAKLAMGDMLYYVPGCRDLHYWPIDLRHFKMSPVVRRNGEALRIAHAPNHPHFKGTRYLVDAVGALKEEGENIELVQVQGVPNAEVIELFRSSHLVADQFFDGFHGYTALEAMALGRPVLCFLRGPDMTIDPDTCPIINTRPEEVYSNLRKCLSGEIDLTALGEQSRNYVDHYYSLEAVAARLGDLYVETAELSPTARRHIAARVDEIRSSLPPLIQGEPPMPWHAAHLDGSA